MILSVSEKYETTKAITMLRFGARFATYARHYGTQPMVQPVRTPEVKYTQVGEMFAHWRYLI